VLIDACVHFIVTGVDTVTVTFHRCRAPDPVGQFFTIECSAGQVINIQSSTAGYSHRYTAKTKECPWYNCTRPIDLPAKECNGRTTCKISQTILIYPQGSVSNLCDLQRDGNFIRIDLLCITGTIVPLCPYFFRYYNAMHVSKTNVSQLGSYVEVYKLRK